MSPDLCHISVIQFLCYIYVLWCSGALSHFLPLFWWQSGVYYSIFLRFCGASGDVNLCYVFLLQSCNRIFCLKSNITNRIDQQSFIHVFSLIFSYFLTFPFFDYTIIIFIIVYTIIISSQWSAVQIPDKILVSSQKFLSDVLPQVFAPVKKVKK